MKYFLKYIYISLFLFPVSYAKFTTPFFLQGDIIYSNQSNNFKFLNAGVLIPVYYNTTQNFYAFSYMAGNRDKFYGLNYMIFGGGYRQNIAKDQFIGIALGYTLISSSKYLWTSNNFEYGAYVYGEYVNSIFFYKVSAMIPKKIQKTFTFDKQSYVKWLRPAISEKMGLDFERFSFYLLFSQESLGTPKYKLGASYSAGGGLSMNVVDFFNIFNVKISFSTIYGVHHGIDFLTGVHLYLHDSKGQQYTNIHRYINSIPYNNLFSIYWTE